MYNDKSNKKKLDDRGIKGILMGYPERSKGYVIYVPQTQTLKLSRNVIFYEEQLRPRELPVPILVDDEEGEYDPSRIPVAPPIEHHQPPPENIQSEAIVQPKALTPVTTPKNVQVKSTRLPGTPIPLKMMDIDDELLEENQSIANRKGQREIKPPARYNDPDFTHLSQEGISIDSEGEYVMMVLTVDGDTSLQGIPESPKTFQEANKSQKWRQAMQDEYDALLANQTWELSELPKGRKAIGCKWTFKLKQNGDGSIARYKARLV